MRSRALTVLSLCMGQVCQRTSTMTKSILAISILALTTSGAFATHHRAHHHAMNAPAADEASAPAPIVWGGMSSNDHADHIKNLHESGYNPKNDFNTNGTIKTQ
jgi:hypothetical protein